MKKIICLFIVTTLVISNIPMTITAAKPQTDTLRVGVFYGSTAKSSCTITSESGFSIGTESDRTFTEQYTLDDTSITITMSADGIASFADKQFDCNNDVRLTIMPKGDNLLSTFGNSYRGGIEILNAGSGNMAIINLINADEYVYGVVGMEMSASWHIEALKAQAVCARNYALSSLNKHKSYGFDICTSTDCQVYGAVNAESEATIKAGKETAGKYLMYNGSLAETLFFSCSGGHTANAKYVWGNEIAYLKGTKDPYENPETTSRYNWSFTYTCDEIKQRLTSVGVDIGDIVNVSATADDKSGYVYELTIIGTKGTHTYKNEKTRTWMGWDKLYSQRYTVTPVTESNTQIYAKSSKGTNSLLGFVTINGSGKLFNLSYPIVMKSSKTTKTLDANAYAFRFDGHGWGHGVGLSQYGAKGMAEQGFDYEQILEFYYNGAYLE